MEHGHGDFARIRAGNQLNRHPKVAAIAIECIETCYILSTASRSQSAGASDVIGVPLPAVFSYILRKVKIVAVITKDPEAGSIGCWWFHRG